MNYQLATQTIAESSMSELLNAFDDSDRESNGMEFVTDAQALRELERWSNEVAKRGLLTQSIVKLR